MGGRGSSSESYKAKQPAYTFGQYAAEFMDQWGNDEIPSMELSDSMRAQGLNGVEAYQVYLDKNNDYAKPQVMDSREFNKYARENGLEVIYRGVADKGQMTGGEMNDATLYGDKYYVGAGVFGSGLYFGNRDVAGVYARQGDTQQGSIVRGALKPGAKVVGYKDVLKLAGDSEWKINKDSSSALSAYARSLGYDAIKTPQGYLNILNRGAMVFSSQYISPYDN